MNKAIQAAQISRKESNRRYIYGAFEGNGISISKRPRNPHYTH